MTTHVEIDMDYAAPLPAVWAMLGDPGYLAAKVAAADSGDFDMQEAGDMRTVRIARVLSVDLPPTARALLGTSISLTETHRWDVAQVDGTRSAELEVAIDGAPITVTGSLHLSPTPTGSRVRVAADITVRVPLFSGMAEGLIRDELTAAIADETALGHQWLTRT